MAIRLFHTSDACIVGGKLNYGGSEAIIVYPCYNNVTNVYAWRCIDMYTKRKRKLFVYKLGKVRKCETFHFFPVCFNSKHWGISFRVRSVCFHVVCYDDDKCKSHNILSQLQLTTNPLAMFCCLDAELNDIDKRIAYIIWYRPPTIAIVIFPVFQ